MAEVGTLSVRLTILSQIQSELSKAQSQLDAYRSANKEISTKLKVDATSLYAQLKKLRGVITVKPQISQADIKAAMKGVTVPIKADASVLRQSVIDALKNLKVQVQVQGAATTGTTRGTGIGRRGLNVDMSTSVFKDIHHNLSDIVSMAGDIATITQGGGILRNVIEIGGALQQQDVALKNLLGTQERQLILTRDIEKIAVKSPLSLEQTYAGVKQLAAYGIQYKDLADTIRRLGDIAAGTGVSMDRLTLAYGQVYTKGRLQGQELRQFTEAGVGMVDGLARHFSKLEGTMVGTAEVYKRISHGKVSFEDVRDVIKDMTNEGGLFFKQGERQAETLLGVWSNLTDRAQLMYKGFLDANGGIFKFFLNIATALISTWGVWLPLLSSAMTVFVAYKAWIIVATLWTKLITTAQLAWALATNTVTMAQKRLLVVMGTNPYALLAAAIGFIVVAAIQWVNGIIALEKHTKELTNATEVMANVQATTREKVQQTVGKFMALSAQYKALGKNTKAQTRFIKEQKGVIDELGLSIDNVAQANELLIRQAPRVIQALTAQAMARAGNERMETLAGGKISIKEKRHQYLLALTAVKKGRKAGPGVQKIIDESRPPVGNYSGASGTGYVQYATPSMNAKTVKNLTEASIRRQIKTLNSQENAVDANMNNLARMTADATAEYQKIMAELGQGKGEGNGGNGGKTGGDERLKELKEWYDKAKDFLSMYEKLSDLYGKEDALKKTIATMGNPFTAYDETGAPIGEARLTTANLYQTAQRDIAEKRNQWIENGLDTTEERRSTLRDMGRYSGTELQIKIDEDSFTREADRVEKSLNKLKDQMSRFKELTEKTGDAGLASKMVFGNNFATESDKTLKIAQVFRETVNRLNNMPESKGLTPLPTDMSSYMDMDDTEWEALGKRAEVLHGIVDEYKAAKKEAADADVETLSEVIALNKTYSDQLAEIISKENEQLAAINQMVREGLINTGEAEIRRDAVKKNAEQERGSLAFKNFQDSGYYQAMFGNLEGYSARALKTLQTNLEHVKDQVKDMKPDDMKAWQEAWDKLDEAIRSKNPFGSLAKNWKDYWQTKKKLPDLEAAHTRALEEQKNAAAELAAALEELGAAQRELDLANYVAEGKIVKTPEGGYAATGKASKEEQQQINGQILPEVVKTGRAPATVEQAQERLSKARERVTTAKTRGDDAEKKVKKTGKEIADADKKLKLFRGDTEKVLGDVSSAFNTAASAAGNLSDMFDKLGNKDLSQALDTVQGLAGGMGNLAGAAESFARKDYFGAVMGAAKGITGIISTLAGAHDTALQKSIEASKQRVTELKYAYEDLQRVIERQLGEQTTAQSDELLENLKGQRDEAARQLRDLQDMKKQDPQQIADAKAQLAELDDQIQNFNKDLVKGLYDLDLKSWASDLGDALFDAWKKGESGAEAFRTKVNDIMGQLVNNILKKRILEKALEGVDKYLFGDDGNGGALADHQLSTDELPGLADELGKVSAAGDEYSKMLQQLNEQLKQQGIDMQDTDSGESSGLGGGIQNITEETADILAAYVNAMRSDLSVVRTMDTAMKAQIESMATLMKQSGLLDTNKVTAAQTAYLSQIAENGRLMLESARNSETAVVAMGDLLRQSANGTRKLAVKVY